MQMQQAGIRAGSFASCSVSHPEGGTARESQPDPGSFPEPSPAQVSPGEPRRTQWDVGAAPAASQPHPPSHAPFPAPQRPNPPVPPVPPQCHHRVPHGRATAPQGPPSPSLQCGLSWGGSPQTLTPRGGGGSPGGSRGTTLVSYIPRAGWGLRNGRAAVSALLSASATGAAAAPARLPGYSLFGDRGEGGGHLQGS